MREPLKILFFLLVSFSISAQHLTHDVGVFVGTGTIQTDYGQRDDFLSSYGNSSVSLSLVHYLQFFNLDTRWNGQDDFRNHLMIKSEFNYMSKSNFQHHGKYTIGPTDLAQQLRAMTGSVSMTSIGIQFEYYLKDLQEFMFPYSEMKWNPYVDIGIKYSFYTNELNSTLGDWQSDITVLPAKYRTPGALAIGSASSFSFVLGAGTRYKLSEKFDLAANFNWQYFLSDAIDGLQANVTENKNNEWLVHFQVGFIYHLNFAGGIFCKR